MVVGLGLMLFRPVWGAALTVAGTIAFFASIGVSGFAYLSLLNAAPVVLAIAWALVRLRAVDADPDRSLLRHNSG